MTSDFVKRLEERALEQYEKDDHDLMLQSAAEIEHLIARVDELEAENKNLRQESIPIAGKRSDLEPTGVTFKLNDPDVDRKLADWMEKNL